MPVPKKHSAGRKKKRLLRRIFTLVVLAALLCGAYTFLKPYLMADSIICYESYTVGRGDIATTKTFSATLSVAQSETLYNTTEAESVKKLYVSGGQEVSDGDALMELSDGTVLYASMDGVVNEIRYAEGDWIRRNVQLVEICDLTNLQVSLQIDEYDVEQITVGQACSVTVVPLNMTFETELKHVSRLSSATGRVAYYNATADLTVPEQVLPGMTASVTIADAEVNDVLVLDMAALSFEDDGSPYVLTKTNSGYVHTAVETGLSDGMQVEIVSGLQEGDTVWVESGTEEIQSGFSLTELYKMIFGETVVINEARGTNQRGGFSADGMSGMNGMPDVANMGGMDMSTIASMTDMQMPEGMTMPDNMEMPEGMTMPDNMEMPDGAQQAGWGGRQQGDFSGDGNGAASMTDLPGRGQRSTDGNGDDGSQRPDGSAGRGGQRTDSTGNGQKQGSEKE